MKHLNPSFEAIKPSIGSSFTTLRFSRNENAKANHWHYHPEIEIVYVGGGSGKRQIGSSITYFKRGDLVMIGSNLPHCGLTNENTKNDFEIVIQFKKEFLGKEIWQTPEMAKVAQLIHSSKSGLVFGDATKKLLEKKIISLHNASSLKKLSKLLDLLNELANTDDYQILNAGKYYLQTQVEDNERINLILNFIKNHFREAISLEEVSDIANMTVPSFCRYFKKITNKTFTQFVNEYRVIHSQKLLAEQPMSITEICFESGFNNFSYFNRTFKEYTGKSPSDYRKEFSQVLS